MNEFVPCRIIFQQRISKNMHLFRLKILYIQMFRFVFPFTRRLSACLWPLTRPTVQFENTAATECCVAVVCHGKPQIAALVAHVKMKIIVKIECRCNGGISNFIFSKNIFRFVKISATHYKCDFVM